MASFLVFWLLLVFHSALSSGSFGVSLPDEGKLDTLIEKASITMTTKPDLFSAALAAEGVTGALGALARSIYAQESSSGKNTETSNRDARGGMQVRPGTFKEVADKDWDIDNPEHNARAGIRYLVKMAKLGDGDPVLAAAGYYGGPGGLAKARKGIAVSDPMNPKAPNTLQYGAQVAARAGLTGTKVPVASNEVPEPQPVLMASAAAEPVADLPIEAGQVVLSNEVLNGLKGRGVTPVPANEANAWQAFLRTLPGRGQPVNVRDIDYQNPMPAVRAPGFQFTPGAQSNQKPNFQAFSAWTGRT